METAYQHRLKTATLFWIQTQKTTMQFLLHTPQAGIRGWRMRTAPGLGLCTTLHSACAAGQTLGACTVVTHKTPEHAPNTRHPDGYKHSSKDKAGHDVPSEPTTTSALRRTAEEPQATGTQKVPLHQTCVLTRKQQRAKNHGQVHSSGILYCWKHSGSRRGRGRDDVRWVPRHHSCAVETDGLTGVLRPTMKLDMSGEMASRDHTLNSFGTCSNMAAAAAAHALSGSNRSLATGHSVADCSKATSRW